MRQYLVGILVFLSITFQSRDLYAYHQPPIIHTIIAKAEKAKVDPALAVAIVEIESKFNPRAERYEPKIHTSSVGLFQLLITTAKNLGFRGSKKDLKKIDNNIDYGLAYLNGCTTKYKTMHDIGCCYNAGDAFAPETCETENVQDYIAALENKYSKWQVILRYDWVRVMLANI